MEILKLGTGIVSNKSQVQIKARKNVPYFTSIKGNQDEFVKKDGSNDNKFTIGEALTNLGKGILSPIKAIVKHPFISLGMIGATVAACTLVPALVPIMTLGFGALSLLEMGKGTYNAVKEYKNGNYDASEKSFEKIGSGLVGTVLTALGLKSSAKSTLEILQAQKTGSRLNMLDKIDIAEKVKTQNLLASFKDTLKIFSKDGIKAVLNGFKPSSIIANAKSAINMFKHKSRPTVSPEELERRSKLSAADIEREAKEIMNKSMDDMGIPQEARPKLVVSDELRYQPVEDVNNIISKAIDKELSRYNVPSYKKGSYNVEVFRPDENLSKMSNEEIFNRIQSVLEQDEKTYFLTDIKKRYVLDSIINAQKPEKGGCYVAGYNTLTVNTGAFRSGTFSLEEIVAHEALHAKMAIYRNSLSAEETSAILKELLRDRIVNGEPEQIIRNMNLLGAEMMTPPKMTPKMRQDFLRYADEFIFGSGKEAEASTRLAAILDTNPEFIVQNGGTRDAALQVLQDYAQSHKFRFDMFAKIKVKDANPIPLTPEQHKMAVESVKDFVGTVEGNSGNQGLNNMFGNLNSYYQYRFSPEELMAYNTGTLYEKAKITALLEDSTLSAAKRAQYQQRIKELDMILEFNRIGKEYYDLQVQLSMTPENMTLAKAVNDLKHKLGIIERVRVNPEYGSSSFRFPINMLPYLPNEG